MNKFCSILRITILAALLFSVQGVNSQTADSCFAGKAVLRWDSTCARASLTTLLNKINAVITDSLPYWPRYYIMFPESLSVLTAVDTLKASPCVVWAIPQYIPIFFSDDLYYSNQWHLEHQVEFGETFADLDVNQAWAIEKGSPSSPIAILDTGIPWDGESLMHPDLQNSETSYPFLIINPAEANDIHLDGHGTAIAGIVAANTNNEGIGVAGIAFAAQVFIGANEEIEVINAIDLGAKVISISWGTSQGLEIWQENIEYALLQGVLVVAASGNAPLDSDILVLPARLSESYMNVIAVGGTDEFDHYWWSRILDLRSQPADSLIVSAPAQAVFTTALLDHGDFDDYRSSFGGTSAATPMVAATAALVFAQAEEGGVTLTPAEVRNIISASADDCNWNGEEVDGDFEPHPWTDAHPGHDRWLGYGRVNTFKALLRTPGWKELEDDLVIAPHYYDNVSPYVIVDQLVVPAGITMTIDAGARLCFAPGASLEIDGGTLIANGTVEDTIRFEIDPDDAGQAWAGVYNVGGAVEISFARFKDATLPIFCDNAVGNGTQDALHLTNSRIIGGVDGLRIWGSPTETHYVENVIIQDVPNLSSYAALYFANTHVVCYNMSVINSGYRTGYIYQTSGKFVDCLFNGATANYGLAFS